MKRKEKKWTTTAEVTYKWSVEKWAVHPVENSTWNENIIFKTSSSLSNRFSRSLDKRIEMSLITILSRSSNGKKILDQKKKEKKFFFVCFQSSKRFFDFVIRQIIRMFLFEILHMFREYERNLKKWSSIDSKSVGVLLAQQSDEKKRRRKMTRRNRHVINWLVNVELVKDLSIHLNTFS